jgi:hypothetical protein
MLRFSPARQALLALLAKEKDQSLAITLTPSDLEAGKHQHTTPSLSARVRATHEINLANAVVRAGLGIAVFTRFLKYPKFGLALCRLTQCMVVFLMSVTLCG